MKTFNFKMADNNVLFATLLALIASLIACVEINFAILTTTIYYFLRRILNFIQIVGSNNTKKQFRDEGVYNVFVLNLAKDDFRFVQGKQMPGGTTQGQVWPLCSIYNVVTTKFEIHIAGSVYEVLKQGAVAELLCVRECAIAQ